ncbi:peroxisome assembly factor 2-like isoform X1 [Pseudomyrmex gracilis]|uniref:peroxisome assembly factor 2-like isoform X1 n=1 Tax=Pseudomyrmex gracilis TaxID=219809 RepID=UPI0009957E22|nr:peroxisome assembly factor 2-like isoform X1 [Pseudomyrmex gracilis]XP_020288339.1 peroxisome assembly factor 2-like isoform X1 [Pseudomyrmex gracilis]
MRETRQKLLSTLLIYKEILRGISGTLMRQNRHFVMSYVFMDYLCRKLQKLSKQNLRWIVLPDVTLKRLMNDVKETQIRYVDCDSCALANVQFVEQSSSGWFHICSTFSTRKYKLTIASSPDVKEDTVLISETMRRNLQTALRCEQLDESCFLLPSTDDDAVEFAIEARISSIASPCDCATEVVDAALENYFSYPRYLHVNDIIKIDAKEYARDRFYSSASFAIPVLHFLVKSLKLYRDGQLDSVNSCYIVRGESTLIQEARVHSYIPRRHVCSNDDVFSREETQRTLKTDAGYPSALTESLERLESCVVPFLNEDIQLQVRPIFLVKGSRGCGKDELVRVASERLGLNMYDVDLAKVQTLTSAQTEAKLRTVLQNAQRYVPCILYLNNIQVFGKTAEGQKDERVISAFTTEIAALYEKRRKFPLIVVAASDESDLPAELHRIFIETVHVKHLNQNERAELMSWFLSDRNLTTTADLSKVAGLCSDFRFADLLALSLHAIKSRCKTMTWHDSDDSCKFVLTQEDFDRAYDYMQSIQSDSEGAPRVPEVRWEDVGGLTELKHEITRRIQLPLLNAFGFGKSGLLLYGPPGTGKTLLAKAVATEYQLHFLSIKGPEVLNMYVGQSEKNVRQIFERARAAAPCIIFFDELDSLAPNRGKSGDSGGVMDRVVSQLLTEMDGLEDSGNVFIIGATNRIDLIDPALLRPGRFDKMLYVGIHSDRASKLNVLKAQTRKFTLQDNQVLEQVVDQLPDNVTGADLYSVSSNAWLNAVREALTKRQEATRDNISFEEDSSVKDSVVVGLQHFADAIRDLVPSVSDEEIGRYAFNRKKL